MPSQPANKVLDHELYDLSACDCPLEKSTFLHSHLSNCAMWTSHKNFVRVDDLPPLVRSDPDPGIWMACPVVPPFNGTEYDPFGFDATIAKAQADLKVMRTEPDDVMNVTVDNMGQRIDEDPRAKQQAWESLVEGIAGIDLGTDDRMAMFSVETDANGHVSGFGVQVGQGPRTAGKPPTPLDTQVGGDHYKKLGIQPIEYIHANGIPFAEGCAIKYLTRWRDKGGIKDLEKARHFIDLLIELETKSNCKPAPTMQADTPPGVQHQPV